LSGGEKHLFKMRLIKFFQFLIDYFSSVINFGGGILFFRQSNVQRLESVKKHKMMYCFTVFFLTVLLSAFSSKVAFAQNEEEYLLFQTIEQITLNEGVTIPENTYLYGIIDGETIKVQFSDSYTYLPEKSVSLVENLDNKPEFVPFDSISNYELLQPNSGTSVISKSNSSKLIVNSELQYPVFNNDDNYKSIIFGNIEYLIKSNNFSVDEETITNENINYNTSKNNVNYPPLTTLAGCLKWGLLG